MVFPSTKQGGRTYILFGDYSEGSSLCTTGADVSIENDGPDKFGVYVNCEFKGCYEANYLAYRHAMKFIKDINDEVAKQYGVTAL